MGRPATIVVLVLALLIGGCAERQAKYAVVSGNITYANPVSLPADTELAIRLYDLSRGGSDGVLVGEHRIESSSEHVPARFAVRYDPRIIEPGHTYAVRAELAADDRHLRETSRSYPVLTQGHPRHVDLVLEPVGRMVAQPTLPAATEPAVRAAESEVGSAEPTMVATPPGAELPGHALAQPAGRMAASPASPPVAASAERAVAQPAVAPAGRAVAQPMARPAAPINLFPDLDEQAAD